MVVEMVIWCFKIVIFCSDFTRPEEAVSRISSHENRQIAKLESLIAESNLLETSNFENNSDSLYLERMVSAIYQLSPEVSEPIGASNKPSSTLNPITFSHPTTTVTERSVVNFSQSVGSLFAEKNVRTARAKLSTLSATKEKRETTNFTQQISNDVNEDKYSNGEKVTAENRINVYSTAAASRLFDLSTKIKLNKSKAGSQAVLLTSNQMAWATSAGKSSSSRSFRNTTAIPQHERSFQEVNIVSSTTAELTINNRDTLSNWEVENDEYVASVDDFSGVVDLATQPFITQKLITVDKQPKLKIIQKHQIEQSHVVSTSRTRDIRSIQSIPEPQAQVQQPVRKTSLLYLCGVINRRFRICKPKSHQKHTSQCNSRQLSMTGMVLVKLS